MNLRHTEQASSAADLRPSYGSRYFTGVAVTDRFLSNLLSQHRAMIPESAMVREFLTAFLHRAYKCGISKDLFTF